MSNEFEVGSEVIITSLNHCSTRYDPRELVGKTGRIVDYYTVGDKDLRGVLIDGAYNEASSTGVYWFPVKNLKLKFTEEIMLITNFGKDAKFASLSHPGKPNCSDIGVYYGELNSNEIVVCDYGYDNHALSVRYVNCVDLDRKTLQVVDCEIMGVCDATNYFERKAKEARRKELKKKMVAQAKKYQEEAYWKTLAESDPTMKELYEEFKKLED